MACTKECATAIEAANNARRDWENSYIELKKRYDDLYTKIHPTTLSPQELAPLLKQGVILRSLKDDSDYLWLAQCICSIPGLAVVRKN